MNKLEKLFSNYDWVEDISNKLIIELKKTHDILEEVHSRFFSMYNISNTKFNVLMILYNAHERGLMLSEIGEQMLVTKANVTGLIDRLEKQGFVKRIRHGSDRRKIMAVMTEAGREFTAKVKDSYREWSKNIMTVIDNEEKNNIIKSFHKIQNELIMQCQKSK